MKKLQDSCFSRLWKSMCYCCFSNQVHPQKKQQDPLRLDCRTNADKRVLEAQVWVLLANRQQTYIPAFLKKTVVEWIGANITFRFLQEHLPEINNHVRILSQAMQREARIQKAITFDISGATIGQGYAIEDLFQGMCSVDIKKRFSQILRVLSGYMHQKTTVLQEYQLDNLIYCTQLCLEMSHLNIKNTREAYKEIVWQLVGILVENAHRLKAQIKTIVREIMNPADQALAVYRIGTLLPRCLSLYERIIRFFVSMSVIEQGIVYIQNTIGFIQFLSQECSRAFSTKTNQEEITQMLSGYASLVAKLKKQEAQYTKSVYTSQKVQSFS